MLKLSQNPPVLPPEVESVTQLSGRWWLAHTKSRCEKAFAWDLIDHSIGYFLPLIERVRISDGKKRRVLMPLFSSYVFFCGDEEDRYTAMTTSRLVRPRMMHGPSLNRQFGSWFASFGYLLMSMIPSGRHWVLPFAIKSAPHSPAILRPARSAWSIPASVCGMRFALPMGQRRQSEPNRRVLWAVRFGLRLPLPAKPLRLCIPFGFAQGRFCQKYFLISDC